MRAVWYCTDCDRRIERTAIDDHESRGHHVTGQLRPDRLLGSDPWNVTVRTEADGDGADGSVSESSDAGATNEEVTD